MRESAVCCSDWMDIHLEMDGGLFPGLALMTSLPRVLLSKPPVAPSPGVWARLPGAECLGPRQVQARLPRPTAEEKWLDFVFLKDFKERMRERCMLLARGLS